MYTKTLTKLLAFSGAAICLGTTPGLSDEGRCRQVGGGILTNFLRACRLRVVVSKTFARMGPRPAI